MVFVHLLLEAEDAQFTVYVMFIQTYTDALRSNCMCRCMFLNATAKG